MTARIALALLLALGFYSLAIGIAGGLLFLVYAQVAYWDRFFFRLSIPAVIGAAIILWSILPRPDRFEPPGPLLKPDDHPALFDEIQRVANDVKQSMPKEVYLIPDVNAFVMQRGGIMGIASKRVMGVGLTLLASLSVAEFKAVLAHEFGHYHGGDTKLAPWIYKTRLAIVRTVQGLGESILQLPFILYANLFLILTEAVSRKQEFQADQLAAQAYGNQAIAGGLKKVSGMGPAFEGFFNSEMVPSLNAGYRPPLLEGFQRFIEQHEIATAIDNMVEEELEKGETDLFDTHPSLKDRIAALGDPVLREASGDDSALGLLNSLSDMERALFADATGVGSRMKPVAWEDVGNLALVPLYRDIFKQNRGAVNGILAKSLPESAQRLKNLKYQLPDDVEQNENVEMGSKGAEAVAMALVTILAAKGWTVESLPGQEVRLIQGTHTVRPFSVIDDLVSGDISPDEWRAIAEEAEISEVDLGRVAF